MNAVPTNDALPVSLPLFPLAGALLLPDGDLPLNIFEPRYIAMIKAALAGNRMIGMIQPCPCPEKMTEAARPFYQVGCAGRIVACEETEDGRYLINLQGVVRFRLLAHYLTKEGYREAKVDFAPFEHDMDEPEDFPQELMRPGLIDQLKKYLHKEELFVDWALAKNIPDHRFYTLLAMVCPFSPAEKQALLEAETMVQRCRMLKCLLELACAEENTQSVGDLPC